jgi:hypothetical protein
MEVGPRTVSSPRQPFQPSHFEMAGLDLLTPPLKAASKTPGGFSVFTRRQQGRTQVRRTRPHFSFAAVLEATEQAEKNRWIFANSGRPITLPIYK